MPLSAYTAVLSNKELGRAGSSRRDCGPRNPLVPLHHRLDASVEQLAPDGHVELIERILESVVGVQNVDVAWAASAFGGVRLGGEHELDPRRRLQTAKVHAPPVYEIDSVLRKPPERPAGGRGGPLRRRQRRGRGRGPHDRGGLRRDGVEGVEGRAYAQELVGGYDRSTIGEAGVVDQAARFVYYEEMEEGHPLIDS
eukprot:CAMPEP_0194318416 /NCGR_PEP_ID=MMETSP0171-20130528/15021_1 /TAXON_ID=218684 /ORGANISM="Corethron pennatum, Strain L29A3" /LENGTH=196 /DNA_ID=CAMNT_0039075313 /DNA_START=362 /DNA_END=949 /DNA_ORIENTATION=+